MNSLWKRDDSLVLFVSFTGNDNRFLITHWFTKLSVSMFRTEQILSVFFHTILPLGGVKHRKNVLLLWEVLQYFLKNRIFSKSILSFSLEFCSGDKPHKY